MKPTIVCLTAFLAALPSAEATVIVFSGSSPLSGPLGNNRQFSNGGVTVTASAESLVGNTQPWKDSYLGLSLLSLGFIRRMLLMA